MKMCFTCIFIVMQNKLIFIWIVLHFKTCYETEGKVGKGNSEMGYLISTVNIESVCYIMLFALQHMHYDLVSFAVI